MDASADADHLTLRNALPLLSLALQILHLRIDATAGELKPELLATAAVNRWFTSIRVSRTSSNSGELSGPRLSPTSAHCIKKRLTAEAVTSVELLLLRAVLQGGLLRSERGELDHRRLAADAGLAGPPSAVMPPQPSSSTMVITVPASHALEATRKVRWGAGSSCAESGAVPQL